MHCGTVTPIRAVIRGSGVNQDGHTKGITLPNSEAQADLIKQVYSSAGLDPLDTGYFEAHVSGTIESIFSASNIVVGNWNSRRGSIGAWRDRKVYESSTGTRQ